MEILLAKATDEDAPIVAGRGKTPTDESYRRQEDEAGTALSNGYRRRIA